jgi:hypothetical protein
MNTPILPSRFRSTYLLSVLCAFAMTAGSASAAISSLTWQPSPVDLNDLDHHDVYTWRIDNINVVPATITSATITFNNIANWDNSANVLHIHLLDTARWSGVRSFVDDPNETVTDLTDDFVNARFHNQSGWLVANGTSDTFLKDKSFTTTPTNYTYTLTGSQLIALQQYIENGNDIALGFDPDCHYFNDGISFTLNFTPVPEVAGLIPISVLIAVSVALEIGRRRRARVQVPVRFR